MGILHVVIKLNLLVEKLYTKNKKHHCKRDLSFHSEYKMSIKKTEFFNLQINAITNFQI